MMPFLWIWNLSAGCGPRFFAGGSQGIKRDISNIEVLYPKQWMQTFGDPCAASESLEESLASKRARVLRVANNPCQIDSNIERMILQSSMPSSEAILLPSTLIHQETVFIPCCLPLCPPCCPLYCLSCRPFCYLLFYPVCILWYLPCCPEAAKAVEREAYREVSDSVGSVQQW